MNLKIYLCFFAIVVSSGWNGFRGQNYSGGCSVYLGSSTPVGLFSSKQYYEENAGYAETGPAFELT